MEYSDDRRVVPPHLRRRITTDDLTLKEKHDRAMKKNHDTALSDEACCARREESSRPTMWSAALAADVIYLFEQQQEHPKPLDRSSKDAKVTTKGVQGDDTPTDAKSAFTAATRKNSMFPARALGNISRPDATAKSYATSKLCRRAQHAELETRDLSVLSNTGKSQTLIGNMVESQKCRLVELELRTQTIEDDSAGLSASTINKRPNEQGMTTFEERMESLERKLLGLERRHAELHELGLRNETLICNMNDRLSAAIGTNGDKPMDVEKSPHS